MKLHIVVGSPNCRKILAVVNHLGIAAEQTYYDFFSGELRSPGYLAINPNGKVPAMTDGTVTLWESNAIMQYMADKVGNDELFPHNPGRRADVVRWQCWELAHFNEAFGTLAYETVLKPTYGMGEINAALVEVCQSKLTRFAAVLDRHMTDRDTLVGTGITIADYSMIFLEGFQEAVPFDWSPFPNVKRYFARMRTLDHWARTAPAAPEEIGRKPKAA